MATDTTVTAVPRAGPRIRFRSRRSLIPWLWLPPPVILLAAVTPWLGVQHYDLDEGYNVMRAFLLRRGFDLYGEIWCDQPPLFTVLLAGAFSWAGEHLVTARLLVIFSSLLLSGSLYALVRERAGPGCAGLATAFLLVSTYYLRMSVSIMETIPSLALAVSALALLDRSRAVWPAVLSGICMATAMGLKLNMALFLPFVGIRLCRRLGRDAVCWCLAVFLMLGGLGWWYLEPGAAEIWRTHLIGRSFPEFAHLDGFRVVPFMLAWDPEFAVLAGLGIIFMSRRDRTRLSLPLGWLVVFAVAFLFHRPVWYHYYVLLAPPLCWLAAAGTCDLLATTGRLRAGRWLARAGLVALALLLGAKALRNVRHAADPRFRLDQRLVGAMVERKDTTHWVVALDRQIYPFLAGLPVPPEAAVTSSKRTYGGGFSPASLTRLLDTYLPEQVLFPAGVSTDNEFRQVLEERYAPAFETPTAILYVRSP